MKEVSDEFLNEQVKHHFKYYRRIVLYKRYWDGSAYVLDGGTNIDEYVKRAGKFVAEIDVEGGEWKIGNFDITVKNINREWNRYNPDGLWEGFITEFSEVSVEFGYVDSGDVKRGIALFKGVITFDGVKEDVNNATATLHIRGYQDILDKFSAEDLPGNQIVGSALLGTVDGINTTFTTAHNGVGIIKEVYYNGIKYDVDDFSTSDLNEKNSPAIIEMKNPPIVGTVMTSDYVSWYQDKTFKELLELLLDYAGITDYEIQQVTFPNNVPTDWTQETNTHFNSGTMDGQLYVADEALNMPIEKQLQFLSYQGVVSTNFITAQSFQVDTPRTIKKIGLEGYFNPNAGGFTGGEWLIEIRTDDSGHPSNTILQDFEYKPTSVQSGLISFDFNLAISASTIYWICVKPIGAGAWTTLGYTEPSAYPDGYTARQKIVGWELYTDRDLVFYVKYAADDYKWMSPTKDLGISLEDFGILSYWAAPVGNYKFYTRTQNSPSGFPVTFNPAEWDEVGAGGVITSDVKRYMRVAVRVTYNPQFRDKNLNPFISYINIRYFTSTFKFKLANFTGKSVRGMIKEMAGISDYQFGFTALGKFLFRAKENDPSVVFVLYGVTKILEYKVLWNLLRNKVTATFGKYSKVVSSITKGETSPHSIDKYGVRPYTISGGNLLNDEDVDIATGAAERRYENDNEIKKGCRFRCKIFAQLDLGDIVELDKDQIGEAVTLFGDHLFDDYYFGVDYEPPYGLPIQVTRLEIDTDFMKDGGMEINAMEV